MDIAYSNFVKWYDNHIECGGNIGYFDASNLKNYKLSIPELVKNHLTPWVTGIRKNWEDIDRNYEFYINNNKNFMHMHTGQQCRYLVQHLYMADQDIIYKPVAYWIPGRVNVHPGKSRLFARWAQRQEVNEIIYIDYNYPDADQPYTRFQNVNDAWNGLTYTDHTPGMINTSSFKDELKLVDITYAKHYCSLYKDTNFEQLMFIDDIKDEQYPIWQNVARKYLEECLNNPVRIGKRTINF